MNDYIILRYSNDATYMANLVAHYNIRFEDNKTIYKLGWEYFLMQLKYINPEADG